MKEVIKKSSVIGAAARVVKRQVIALLQQGSGDTSAEERYHEFRAGSSTHMSLFLPEARLEAEKDLT